MFWRVALDADPCVGVDHHVITHRLGEVKQVAEAELDLVGEDGARGVVGHTLVVSVVRGVRWVVDHQLAINDSVTNLC